MCILILINQLIASTKYGTVQGALQIGEGHATGKVSFGTVLNLLPKVLRVVDRTVIPYLV